MKKKLLACLLVVGFASTVYGGSPKRIKPSEEEGPPRPNSAAMEGLMLFEAAENNYEEMMGEIVPDEPAEEAEKTEKTEQPQEEKETTGKEE